MTRGPLTPEPVDVAAEREAVLLRRRVDFRARRALGVAGWGADEATIRRAIEMDPLLEDDDAKLQELQRAATLARALELQADPAVRGRRLTPEEVEMTRQKVELDREAVREYVRQQRALRPKVTVKAMQVECERKFGLEVTQSNFYATYWSKAAPTVADAEIETMEASTPEPGSEEPAAPVATMEPAEPAAPAPVTVPSDWSEPVTIETADSAPAPEATAAPALSSPATAAPRREVPAGGAPFLQMVPLSDGTVRVQIDIALDLAKASYLVHMATAALTAAGRQQ